MGIGLARRICQIHVITCIVGVEVTSYPLQGRNDVGIRAGNYDAN